MDYTQLIGTSAAILTTIANIPQTYRIIKTKSTKDISTLTYCMLAAGFILWVLYGITRNDYPVIIANGISLLVCSMILFLKFCSAKTIDKIKDTITKDE